jgi:hypothetical protein
MTDKYLGLEIQPGIVDKPPSVSYRVNHPEMHVYVCGAGVLACVSALWLHHLQTLSGRWYTLFYIGFVNVYVYVCMCMCVCRWGG